MSNESVSQSQKEEGKGKQIWQKYKIIFEFLNDSPPIRVKGWRTKIQICKKEKGCFWNHKQLLWYILTLLGVVCYCYGSIPGGTQGPSVCSFHVLPVSAWVFSRCLRFPNSSKTWLEGSSVVGRRGSHSSQSSVFDFMQTFILLHKFKTEHLPWSHHSLHWILCRFHLEVEFCNSFYSCLASSLVPPFLTVYVLSTKSKQNNVELCCFSNWIDVLLSVVM